MGWKRSKYKKIGYPKIIVPSKSLTGDGRDFIFENFVFRPHFFNNYRARVADPDVGHLTDGDIARIAAHCLNDGNLPERLPLGLNYNALVIFHRHCNEKIEEFGLHYVPLRRDIYDLRSGRICAVTILNAEERFSRLIGGA